MKEKEYKIYLKSVLLLFKNGDISEEEALEKIMKYYPVQNVQVIKPNYRNSDNELKVL